MDTNVSSKQRHDGGVLLEFSSKQRRETHSPVSTSTLFAAIPFPFLPPANKWFLRLHTHPCKAPIAPKQTLRDTLLQARPTYIDKLRIRMQPRSRSPPHTPIQSPYSRRSNEHAYSDSESFECHNVRSTCFPLGHVPSCAQHLNMFRWVSPRLRGRVCVLVNVVFSCRVARVRCSASELCGDLGDLHRPTLLGTSRRRHSCVGGLVPTRQHAASEQHTTQQQQERKRKTTRGVSVRVQRKGDERKQV